jgi:hypothetical protein
MYRQLYQMGGIGTLPMDYGQSLQVPQQPQSSFYFSTKQCNMSPLLNYGQSQLGQEGGTPLTRNGYQEGGMGMTQLGAPQEEPIFPRLETLNENLGQAEQRLGSPSNNQFNISPMTSAFTGRPQMNLGGITRLGYEEGGMGMDQMIPQDQAMMQPQQQMGPPLEGIMGAMPQDAGMMQEGGQEETALLTIIQLLIEQGVPPEQAQELAMQILQVFNQGGAPAVEEFANQLEQEEGMPENRTMMAGGGITGIYPRQGYFFKGVVKAVSGAVKGVAKAVKSVAKSPIGMIALSIAAPYAISAFAPGFATLGGSGILGGALRAGISNLAVQGILTGKINPKQALLAAAAGGAMAGFQGADAMAAKDAMNAGDYMQYGSSVQEGLGTSIPLKSGVIPSDIGSYDQSVQKMYDTSMITPSDSDILSNVKASSLANTQGQTVQQLGEVKPLNMFDKGITSIKDFGTNLMADPLKTIGNVGSSIYQTAKDNALPLATGFLAGSSLAQQPNESDDEYASRAARDANVAAYITQYGGGSKLYSPTFYSMEKAIDPFAGRSAYVANGGRIGYADGTSLEKQYLAKKGYGDMIRNMNESEILKLYDSVVGTFSRRFQAEGTMPMGEPRKNPAGIMELDYRAKGGFVPPVGIKEKADDIPAMLSNNEFVFTADAVRNAGGGNVDRGAQRMYSLMKNLESGGRV